MNNRHPVCAAITLAICLLLAIPAEIVAQTAQEAGKISLAMPIAYLLRGSQQINAEATLAVMWGDVINTGHLARVRVTLEDGSILNIGSDSNLRVAKHDAGAQQTDLELNYGRVRAKAVKLVKPDAHFEIRTPVGVAGVVGTEIIVVLNPDGTLNVLCLEGACRVCNNAGVCVVMKGGEETSIRGNSAPSQPTPVTPANQTDFMKSTNVSSGGAGGGVSSASGAAGGGAGAAGGTVGAVAGIAGAAAAAVTTVVVRTVSKTKTCPPPTTGGIARSPAASCTTTTQGGVPRLPGQKPL
jgi:FecR protein